MKKLLFLSSLALSPFLFSSPPPHPTQIPPVIPIENFFREPSLRSPLLSKKAKSLAYLAPHQNRANLFVQKIKSKNDSLSLSKPKQITSFSDRSIAGFLWKGDTHILFFRDSNGDENHHLFSIHRNGQNLRDLTPFPNTKTILIDDLYHDNEHVLIGLNNRDPQAFDIYKLNILSGELSLIHQNPGNQLGWLTDHHGNLRVALEKIDLTTNVLYRDSPDQPFSPILSFNYKDSFQPTLFTYNNKKFYALSNITRDKLALVLFNPISKKEEKIIFEHPDVDLSSISSSDKKKKLTAVIYTLDKTQFHFLDEKSKERYSYIKSLYPEHEIQFISKNKQESTWIFATYSDRQPPTFYLFNSKTKQILELANSTPWLNPSLLAPMSPISYQSRDGITLHAYLTLPLNRTPKNLPLIVLPHGGPEARDSWSYDPEVQFLANRGYAVLQPNFRGSDGYGKHFLNLAIRQWGLKMQDDISDGVLHLINQGLADPKRVAIYGASYGGYAALAGLAFTPDLYACGISVVGPSNLITLLQSIPPYWKVGVARLYEHVGNPSTDQDFLKKISPLFHVDNIKAPVLLAHGAHDPRVKKEESHQMVLALQKRNIPVQYILKDNDGHGFMNQENRIEFYSKLEAFLSKYLPTSPSN